MFWEGLKGTTLSVLPWQPTQIPFSTDVRSWTQDHPQAQLCCEADKSPVENYFFIHSGQNSFFCMCVLCKILIEEKSESRKMWDLHLRSSWSWKINDPLSGSCTFHATYLSKSKQHKTHVGFEKQHCCSRMSPVLFHDKISNERTCEFH